jgi:16S rRNA (guanine527-N7)-methyltransferase
MNETIKVNLPVMAAEWQQTLNWEPTAAQQQLFQHFYDLIIETNRTLNLTRITDPLEFWEKHLWDSLRGMKSFFVTSEISNSSVLNAIDIGTGGGFPGIPIAISFPQCRVTLIDSTRKKIAFVQQVIKELELENAIGLNARAEEINHKPPHQGSYDIAFLRAITAATTCAKYAFPFLKKGGLAILYRGHWQAEEEKELKVILKQLGGKIELIDAFTTPLSEGVRHCIYLRKL